MWLSCKNFYDEESAVCVKKRNTFFKNLSHFIDKK